jgi:hypothetical protein
VVGERKREAELRRQVGQRTALRWVAGSGVVR